MTDCFGYSRGFPKSKYYGNFSLWVTLRTSVVQLFIFYHTQSKNTEFLDNLVNNDLA